MGALLLLIISGLVFVESTHQSRDGYRVIRKIPSRHITNFTQCVSKYQDIYILLDHERDNDHINPSVRLRACTGHCGDKVAPCRPVTTEIKNFSVSMREYDEKTETWGMIRKKIISLEEETSCKCSCPERLKKCPRNKVLNERTCNCVCAYEEEMLECIKEETKYWDPAKCSCDCRDQTPCDKDDERRDLDTCMCEKIDFQLDAYDDAVNYLKST